jgi:hypothetical protein
MASFDFFLQIKETRLAPAHLLLGKRHQSGCFQRPSCSDIDSLLREQFDWPETPKLFLISTCLLNPSCRGLY